MRGVVAALLLCAAATLARAAGAPQPPQVLYGPLYAAVESAGLYADSKSFADAVPREAPSRIRADYRAQHPDSNAALAQFVAQHFTLPDTASPATIAQLGLAAHIDALWDALTRRTPNVATGSSLLPLPKPYVVPGGRFRELYYWDSYFTMLGLAASGRQDLLRDMVQNFAYLIDTYGHVPNGTRSYYLSRSQPPFFFAMVALLDPADPAAAYRRYLPQLRREHAFWMQGEATLRPGSAHRRVVALADGTRLNRYWDDRDTPRDESYREDVALAAGAGNASQRYRDLRAAAESGWDFSSRWLSQSTQLASIDTTRIVPVDLNSLLYGLEIAIQSGCARAGKAACARSFQRQADARRGAMQHYLWDSAAARFSDYDWTARKPTAVLSAAMLYPLFTGAATAAQAEAVAHSAMPLVQPGGFATTLVVTGQQWDAPNGWAPLQWIAIMGLRRYQQPQLAASIACRWLVNVSQEYVRETKLLEKYDIATPGRRGGGGEYPTQDGFGWTNGVTRSLIALYPAEAAQTDARRCPSPQLQSAPH